ncbi:cellulose binding domain-containing protein [Streptomyces viridosporus]|uniref:cellulose binding domain-containing protein n=1 Tax=Streptomyces viridosporus TaxID=67581 RepID=UPI001C0A818F|nr:cellulose binding domain-containing protein [Streptomyces viridosporus]
MVPRGEVTSRPARQGATGGGPGTPGGACTATYRTVSSWSGGFRGEVSVRNDGTGALGGWTVGMTLAPGQSLSNPWNGRNTGTTGAVTARNTDWNGTLAPGAATTFGFTVTASASTAPHTLTCGSP